MFLATDQSFRLQGIKIVPSVPPLGTEDAVCGLWQLTSYIPPICSKIVSRKFPSSSPTHFEETNFVVMWGAGLLSPGIPS